MNKLLALEFESERLSSKLFRKGHCNSFRQDISGSQFVYTSVCLPLYNSFHFHNIIIHYLCINNSDQSLVGSFLTREAALAFIKDQEHSNNLIIKVRYTYDSVSSSKLDTSYEDIPWGESFNGARRALRHLQTPRSILKEYMRWCGITNSCIEHLVDYSLQIVMPFFDTLKSTLHARINNLPPEFRYYLDIPSIAGYPKMKYRQLKDDPKLWLTDVTHSEYSSAWWSNAFIHTFGESVVRNPDCLLTLREFAHRRWLWSTNGATRFSRMEIDNEVAHTKFGAAVSLTDKELDHLIDSAVRGVDPLQSNIGVFIKPDEKGYKRRLIANVPLGGYIIAAYIRYLITQFVGEYPIFANLSPTTEQIFDVFTLLKAHHTFYPLDESAYDYNVSRESWDGFFSFLFKLFPNNEGVILFRRYFNVAIWSFDGKKGKWNAGMPSGLALTSFLNSWMNYIKQRVIVPGDINWAAGDDVLALPYKEKSLTQISEEYKKFGSVSNPVKNWKSNKYCEYLKRIYSAKGSSGYPSRVYASLIYAGTERFYLPSDRLPELAELFKQFFDRLGLHMDERYVAKDLARAVSNKVNGFNMYTALDWLHAPRIHGGFGKLPYNNKTFTWSVQTIHYSNITNTLIRVPRPLHYDGSVSLSIGSYYVNPATNYRLGPPLHLLPIETLADWERRINRDDIDYHGPFQSLVLDVIPLPTVDFISTSLMSQIASDNYYNAYPNLHGSWQTIASRLLRASEALATLVITKMIDRQLTTLI